MSTSATLPVGITEPAPRIEPKTFTHNNETWVYNADLITMEQAVLADEALQFKLELLQREVETFTTLVEAGGVEWFARCAGALLVRHEGGVPVPHSPAQWAAAAKFVNKLPYKHMAELRECIEDFFGSIGRASIVSHVFNAASKKKSNGLLSALLMQAMKTRDESVSGLNSENVKQA